MENVEADLKTFRNSFGRVVQVLKFNEVLGNQPSRDYYLTEEEALDVLANSFVFENGKEYRIKYLVSQGWRSGNSFTKQANTNLKHYVYDEEYQIANYHGPALDEIKIFGIEVAELKPAENIDWDDILER